MAGRVKKDSVLGGVFDDLAVRPGSRKKKPAGRRPRSIRFQPDDLERIEAIQERITQVQGSSDFSETVRFLVRAGLVAIEQGAVEIETETEAVTRLKMP